MPTGHSVGVTRFCPTCSGTFPPQRRLPRPRLAGPQRTCRAAESVARAPLSPLLPSRLPPPHGPSPQGRREMRPFRKAPESVSQRRVGSGRGHVQPAPHPLCRSRTRGHHGQEAEGTGIAGSFPLGQRSPEAHPLTRLVDLDRDAGPQGCLRVAGPCYRPALPHWPGPAGRSGERGPDVCGRSARLGFSASPAARPPGPGPHSLPRLVPQSGWKATEDGRSSQTICSSSVFCEFIFKW